MLCCFPPHRSLVYLSFVALGSLSLLNSISWFWWYLVFFQLLSEDFCFLLGNSHSPIIPPVFIWRRAVTLLSRLEWRWEFSHHFPPVTKIDEDRCVSLLSSLVTLLLASVAWDLVCNMWVSDLASTSHRLCLSPPDHQAPVGAFGFSSLDS